ncbi:MAG: PAS domain S-box protein [Cellvibrionaceae bacterium]
MDIEFKEDLFQAVFQQTNNALIIANKNLIIASNPQAKKLLNIDDSEALKELPISLQSLVNFTGEDSTEKQLPHLVLLDNNIPVSVKISTLELSIQRLTLIQLTTTFDVSDNFNDSEKQLKIVFDRSPVGIAINDFKTGTFIDVNPSFAKSAGRSREELIGMHYKDITPPKHAEIDAEAVATLFLDDAFPQFEKEFIRKDGIHYKIRLNGIALTNKEGKKVVWSVVEDITEQKQLEQSVKVLSDFLTPIENQANIGAWIQDRMHNHTTCSEHLYEIYGLDKKTSEISYEKLLERVHPSDRKDLDERHQASIRERLPYSHICRLIMPNKSVKYVQINCETRFNDQGKPEITITTVQDITSQHREKTFTSDILDFPDYSKDFIAISDLEGNIHYVNQSGQALIDIDLGETPELLSISNLYILDQQHIIEGEVIPGLNSTGHWSGELKLKHQSGNKEILTHCDAFRIDDKKTNKPRSLVFISSDITQQRHYETEVEQYHNHLIDTIHSKSKELEQAQNESRLAKSEREKLQSCINHGIRTSIDLIRDAVQNLKGQTNHWNETQVENLERISKASGHLASVVETLPKSGLEEDTQAINKNTQEKPE